MDDRVTGVEIVAYTADGRVIKHISVVTPDGVGTVLGALVGDILADLADRGLIKD